ncbi:MAG TPA: Gfo/Idh/MocA family oxidoreductase [bacterium]|nr:Gfo/Idh/MocA family oxidoreductase [bacterium]
MTVKVGILGAGYIGGVHARNLRRDERVELVGIADIRPEAAQRLAGEVGTRPLPDLDALLHEGAQAVYVTTPNAHHVDPVVRALGAGVHVFSEKPMATTLEGARQIVGAATRSRGRYQLGFNRRWAPGYAYVRELIAAGELRPTMAHIKMNRGELQNPPWVSTTALTGGFLYESTIHLLDMCRFLLGDVAAVLCQARTTAYQEPDGFAAILRCASGALVTFHSCAHATWIFPFERIELFGPHQAAVTEEMERVCVSPGLGREITTRNYFQLPVEEKWGYRLEDRRFLDAIVDGRPPAVTAEDGLRATELVEACYRSARTGAEVGLPLG